MLVESQFPVHIVSVKPHVDGPQFTLKEYMYQCAVSG